MYSKYASKEIGLEVNAEKTKYIVMSRNQNAGQNGYIQIGNKSFETLEQFKYLGTAITNQNVPFMKKIKTRLKQGMLAIILCRIFCLPVRFVWV